MFDCMLGRPRKMDELEVFSAALEEYDLPAGEVLAGIQDPEVKQKLIDSTNAALARGAVSSA
jgi:2-hydroxychromene-2-carboxylate isomerase